MDAASSGEAARLRATVETVKGELAHLRNENVGSLVKLLQLCQDSGL